MWTKDQTDIFAEFAKDYNVTSPLAKTIDITELLQYLELDGYHGLSTDNGELVDNLVAAKVRRKLGSVAIATTPNTKDKFVTDEVQDEAEERKEQLGLVTRLRLRLTPHHISVVNNYLHGSPKLSTSNPPLQAQSRAREAQGIARETQRQVRGLEEAGQRIQEDLQRGILAEQSRNVECETVTSSISTDAFVQRMGDQKREEAILRQELKDMQAQTPVNPSAIPVSSRRLGYPTPSTGGAPANPTRLLSRRGHHSSPTLEASNN
ncbi:hypothetical protein MMC08_002451 [Hypocenomyce scalaris]|nr:hypothetical protein [Hypocenomyce scalaris]